MEKTLIDFYVGIDNSHSGAIAIINGSGIIIDTFLMPVYINGSGDNECDYLKILKGLWNVGCYENNTRVMLEEPHKFSKGSTAIITMWSCYQRIKVGFECNGLRPDCILPNQWQTKMLDKYGDGKSKEWAEKKVMELFGDEVKMKYKNKKLREGVNDALLIAEFLRRSHLDIAMPEKLDMNSYA